MTKKKAYTYPFLCLSCLLMLGACTGQNGSVKDGLEGPGEDQQNSMGQPVITFESKSHDFGTIIEGEQLVCFFDYTNTGGGELIIYSVEATCGCTTPDFSREPLKPGEKNSLKVIFNSSGRSGTQRKIVRVRSNGSEPEVQLSLKANVKN